MSGVASKSDAKAAGARERGRNSGHRTRKQALGFVKSSSELPNAGDKGAMSGSALRGSHSTVSDARRIRLSLGVSQTLMSRLINQSIRNVSALENNQLRPNQQTLRRLNEILRLQKALGEIMSPEETAEWIVTPSEGFDGFKPVEVIERGEIDRIWRMIFLLQSGVVS